MSIAQRRGVCLHCGHDHDKIVFRAPPPSDPDEITRLRAEVEALREDAARYRDLRRGQRWRVVDGIGDVLRAEALDAAIDAARAKGST